MISDFDHFEYVQFLDKEYSEDNVELQKKIGVDDFFLTDSHELENFPQIGVLTHDVFLHGPKRQSERQFIDQRIFNIPGTKVVFYPSAGKPSYGTPDSEILPFSHGINIEHNTLLKP